MAKSDPLQRANLKLMMKELCLPVLLDARGRDGGFTFADWEHLTAKYGGKVARGAGQTEGGPRVAVPPAGAPRVKELESLTNVLPPRGGVPVKSR